MDDEERPFFFCVLSGNGAAQLVSPPRIANAKAIIDPADNARIGTSVYVECSFEALVSDVAALLGVADGPSSDGKTAELSVVHYVPSFVESAPSAATVASGTLLQYAGQAVGNQITFSYSAATSNPTLNPTSGALSYLGPALWTQNCGAQTDAQQDQAMDTACSAEYAGSRGATEQEFYDGSVLGMPSDCSNIGTGNACTPTNVRSLGPAGGSCLSNTGYYRNCYHKSGGPPFGPGTKSSCASGERMALCIK